MRFSIEKTNLQSALKVASLAVTKVSGVITSSILFEMDTDGSLVLWATDRRIMVKVPASPVEGTTHGSGSFTVEAGRLSQWVKSVFEDTVDVEVEGATVTMECGKATGHFASLDSAQFPDFSDRLEGPEVLFEMHPKKLTEALKFVSPFIGDATTNNATANNFQVTELRGYDMIATDSRSLATFKVGAPEGEDNPLDFYAEGEGGFKITKDELGKLVKFIEQTCALSARVSKSGLYVVESDDGSLFGYPQTNLTLPKIGGIPQDLSEPEIWQVNKDRLQNAVNALSATADPDDVVLTVRAEGPEGGEGILTLSMKDALERHESVVEIPFTRTKTTGEKVAFRVNRVYLTNPVSLFDGESVTLAVSAGPEAKVKYVKFFGQTEDGDTRTCLVTLRMDL